MLGLVFFTQDDIRFDDDYVVTEEKTGFLIRFNKLNTEHWIKKVFEKINETTPVKDLPNHERISDIGYNKKGEHWNETIQALKKED